MAEQLTSDIPLRAMHDLTEQYRALESLRERLEAILQVLIGGVSISDSSIQALLETTALASTSIAKLEEDLGLLDDRVVVNEDELDTLLAHPAIANLNNTAITASGTYQQAQLQTVANAAEAASDKLDTLLTTLRSAGVLNV